MLTEIILSSVAVPLKPKLLSSLEKRIKELARELRILVTCEPLKYKVLLTKILQNLKNHQYEHENCVSVCRSLVHRSGKLVLSKLIK